jgi:hypothetical protein
VCHRTLIVLSREDRLLRHYSSCADDNRINGALLKRGVPASSKNGDVDRVRSGTGAAENLTRWHLRIENGNRNPNGDFIRLLRV